MWTVPGRLLSAAFYLITPLVTSHSPATQKLSIIIQFYISVYLIQLLKAIWQEYYFLSHKGMTWFPAVLEKVWSVVNCFGWVGSGSVLKRYLANFCIEIIEVARKEVKWGKFPSYTSKLSKQPNLSKFGPKCDIKQRKCANST